MTLASLVTAYTRTPSATVYLNGQRWHRVIALSRAQTFGGAMSGGRVTGREPPVTPTIGMAVSWTWGYNGQEVAGFTGEISDVIDHSYPDRWELEVKDTSWRADKAQQVLATSPLNSITASAAVVYLLNHYGGIPTSRLSIPTLAASGSEWGGAEWTLGVLTPVQWGDTDTGSGGTTALKAAQEICSCLGYWLYCGADGIIRARQMERKPASTAAVVYREGINFLVTGAPDRRQSYEAIYNRVVVRGANTGVDGAQIMDAYQTAHPLLPSGVYREYTFSSSLIEYVNPSEAGAASATSIAQRILNVMSRVPNVITARAKADPRRAVGDTVGVVAPHISISTQQNFFIYGLETTLDLQRGVFDQQLTLDGGTGSTGYTTIPAPEAAFSWTLMSEGLDGNSVVDVFLDGTASTSPSGEIVSYAWSTSTATYGGTPNAASGPKASFVFLASEVTATVTLTVTDTTSKTGTLTQDITLAGDALLTPLARAAHVAFGAAWYATPDGGRAWNTETSGGAAIVVPEIGAGVDSRAIGSGATYGLLTTRGASSDGLRRTLDTLATASTSLASTGVVTAIWVNEANPARVWVAVGGALKRSTDGGATFTTLTGPGAGAIRWIIEDPAVDNSVFICAGANVYNTTAPALAGAWAVLYEGPTGATARQLVRSRDGQITWVCYTGTFTGDPAQRIETGAGITFPGTPAAEIRALALDPSASVSGAATLYAISGDDPARIFVTDGLTGAGTTESTQTFPAGATVQHAIHDPSAPIVYCADFDSVAAGQGAARKYLPQADQLLLWKAGAAGEQAHMIGLGASNAAPVEVMVGTHGDLAGSNGVWHYTPASGWALQSTGLPATVWYARALAAAPTDPDVALLLINAADDDQYAVSGGTVYMVGTTDTPLYYTDDGGATWSGVAITTVFADGASPLTLSRMEFSDVTAGQWWMAGSVTPDGSIWRGTDGGAPTETHYLGDRTTYITAGLDGDAIVRRANTGKLYRIDSGMASHDITSADQILGQAWAFDRLPMPGAGLVAVELNESDVLFSADYRASSLVALSLGQTKQSISAGQDAIYANGSDVDEIRRITGLPGTATATTIVLGGTLGPVRVGRQRRVAVAVREEGSNDVYLSADGVTFSLLAGPAALSLANHLEVIER